MRTHSAAMVMMLTAVPAMAGQVCDTSHYPLSAPTQRFTDNGDGTVTDTRTHLMWMRCSLGQSWTGTTCAGDPTKMPWQAAQEAIAAINQQGGYAKHNDWRLPRIPQLAGITEVQCANPRTNLTVFPNTPASIYWTASSRPGPGNQTQAFILSFGPEGTGADLKIEAHLIRPVRTTP